ncbi:coiled-coil domain-containing protein, partial [Neobacillus niacini]|uniref:coiled-coil domain-containing protein n=1 Tax=Neobacillus niacini TaxID=86668 RepID=UPI0030003842
MQKIALIQNQVYMSYASKSDIRPLLANFGYQSENVNLYTSHNIKKLKYELGTGEIDAVIFSSNSLSEKSIKAEVESESFVHAFSIFLNQGKGCLILHQLNIASGSSSDPGGTFKFLPMKSPKAVKRVKEDVTKGDFIKSRITESHPLFNYPNYVSIQELKQHCIRKKGLYWHYLDDVDSTEWDVLLHDESENFSRRPLLITPRETSKHRVVISSLNLDWQREEILLQNMILFVLEGKCNTAILKDATYNSMAFEFFLKTLNSQNYRFRLYELSSDLSEFKKQIEQGIHSIVVLGPTNLDGEHREKEELLNKVDQFLNPYINEGKVKYIGIEPEGNNFKQFFIAGREKFALRILQDTEIKIHRIFQQNKLIDDSFWSSVETLKLLTQMEEVNSTFTMETVKSVFEYAQKNLVANASYNGLLVPTSSLLWLRAKYLGVEAEETQNTINWMKLALLSGEEAEIECVLAYNTLLELQIDTEFTTEQLNRLITSKDLTGYNEIEIVHYIKAAILLKDIEKIKAFITTLETKRNQEMLWIDIAISANIVNLLLEALVMLKEHDAYTADIEETIEKLVFPTVIIMQNMTNTNPGEAGIDFKWDNKANTTLKCVSAMLKFEELMDLPVTEMVQSIVSYSHSGNQLLDNKTALQVIEEFKEANKELEMKNKELDEILNVQKTMQQALLDEKIEMEDQNQQLIEKNKQLKQQNEKYEDDLAKNDGKVTAWKYLIAVGAVFLLLLILNGIFFFNHKKAFKDLISFYNLEWNIPALVVFIFTGLFGLMTNNLLRKNQIRNNRQ